MFVNCLICSNGLGGMCVICVYPFSNLEVVVDDLPKKLWLSIAIVRFGNGQYNVTFHLFLVGKIFKCMVGILGKKIWTWNVLLGVNCDWLVFKEEL